MWFIVSGFALVVGWLLFCTGVILFGNKGKDSWERRRK